MKTARFMQAVGVLLIAVATHWTNAQGVLKNHYCLIEQNACDSSCRHLTGQCLLGTTYYDFYYVEDQYVDGERCAEGGNHSCEMRYDDVTRCDRKFYVGPNGCVTQVCGIDVGDYIEMCVEDP